MSIYGIIGVQLGEDGRVVRASARQVDPASNSWMEPPSLLEAHQVANLIVKGNMVFAIVIADQLNVHGPQFRRVVYPGGTEGIELEQNEYGRTVRDLVQHSVS